MTERARFVSRITGEDVYVFSGEMSGYYCVICGPTGRSLYCLPEIIDHKWKQHTDYYYEDGQTKSRLMPGCEALESVISV